MDLVIIFVVLAVAIYAISGPLLAARGPAAEADDPVAGDPATVIEPGDPMSASDGPELDLIAELEAARDAKYQEIRDAELDLRTGKLSDEDYQAIDQTLRAEAVGILHELDRARESERELPSAS
ncbi:MAG: hypothetical protein JOZ07_01295 [Solirubrobacterales bacterium]|nr:hypothetical protein [Solirubrobacterales bacterium]